MITDIVFDTFDFIVELPTGATGGTIIAYSLDNNPEYDYTSSGGEVSYVFIS